MAKSTKLKGKKITKLVGLSYNPKKKSTKRFKIDKRFTNNKHTVVTDKKRKRKIVVFKGTNPTDVRDLRSDLALGIGVHASDPRFKNSKSIVKKVRKASKKEGMGSKLTLIGHSLGGSLAEYASKKKDKTLTVNKGAGIKQIGKKTHKNQTDLRNKNDLVSALSSFNKGKGKVRSAGNSSLTQLGDSGAHSYKDIPKENKY